MNHSFNKINRLEGTLNLPGDKSISHRSLLFSAMSKGESIIRNLSIGEDVISTMNCLKEIGVRVNKINNLHQIHGCGFKGFSKPKKELDAGNSGTTARLIAGLLSAQEFESVITGDVSLSRRPMKRIIDPLTEMGAEVTSSTGFLPLFIRPVVRLRPIQFRLILPSAQVKSSVILAAIHLEEESEIIEYIPSRDHTERMLGLDLEKDGEKNIIHVSRNYYPQAREYFIPSDISSSVFFIVLALLTPGSKLRIRNISLNPSRTGIIEIFKMMGASITEENVQTFANEPFGDIIIKSSELRNIEIPLRFIPNIIDEIPALTIAGIFAEGDFSISDAEELRHKESDRIAALCTNLKNCGLKVDEYIDGFSVTGSPLNRKFLFDSYGDHRIAMALAVMSMLSESGGEVKGFECVNISNPSFLEQLNSVVS